METLVETTETVTTIKPSEALRLGRLTRPIQGRGHYFGADGEACALGAIGLGYGYDGEESVLLTIEEEAPRDFVQRWTSCPESGGHFESYDRGDHTLIGIVAHLNDDHAYTDEQMVDYLEGMGL